MERFKKKKKLVHCIEQYKMLVLLIHTFLLVQIPSTFFIILIIGCFGHGNVSYFKPGCFNILSASDILSEGCSVAEGYVRNL